MSKAHLTRSSATGKARLDLGRERSEDVSAWNGDDRSASILLVERAQSEGVRMPNADSSAPQREFGCVSERDHPQSESDSDEIDEKDPAISPGHPTATAKETNEDFDDVAEERKRIRRYLNGTKIYFQAAGPRDVVLLNAVESGYRVVHKPTDADIVWIEASPHTPTQLKDMLPHQRINCIPGMKMCSTKCEFSLLMLRMQQLFPGEFDFIPTTFAIPGEEKQLKKFGEEHPKQIYVIKPDGACGGDGIYLTNDPLNVKHPECVVQTYISNPMLIGGLKFDFRLYVVVTSVSPLRYYICKEGLGRMAVEPYEQPSKANFHKLNMHLTNYSLNKFSTNFVSNVDAEDDSESSKRAASTAIRQLKEQGTSFDEDEFWQKFEVIVGKTLAALVPSLTVLAGETSTQSSYLSQCFQVLGFDILVDDEMNLHLLEINHHPSLQTDAPIDMKVKSVLLRPTVRMIANYAKRNRCLAAKKQPFLAPTAEEAEQWESVQCGPDMIACSKNDHLSRFIDPFVPWRDYFLFLCGCARRTSVYSISPGFSSLRFMKFARNSGIAGPGAPMLTPEVDLLFMRKARGPSMDFDTFLDTLLKDLGDLLAPETRPYSQERLSALYQRLVVNGVAAS